jgi:pyruvate formate lyase activating enzyme
MIMGTVFSIKRFALHDGNGLRTTMFLKGCPLRCPWCQNPEGLTRDISLIYYPKRCFGCGTCISACPEQAISWKKGTKEKSVGIDHDACTLCGICIDACPANALVINGWEISCETAVEELLKDRTFFTQTGGGITLSGGEPLMQPDFACCIAQRCHEEGINVAIETSLQTDRNTISRLLPYIDTWFTDLKIAHAEDHRKIIGFDNQAIVDNLRFLVSKGACIVIRVPLIPGFTDQDENITALAVIIAGLDPQPPVELLSFNPLPAQKYQLLGKRWPFPEGTGKQSQQRIEEIVLNMKKHKVRSIIA